MDLQGILTGGAIVFFTYIGFDSVSTAAEECKDPKRDLPIGILVSLFVCSFFYIAVALVLTGIQHWNTLDNAAPVAHALEAIGLNGVNRWVTAGALMGMISSILVFQLGQARVWFAMSRDGLLPRSVFSRAQDIPDAGCGHVGGGLRRRDSRRDLRHRHAGRPLEYRHTFRVYPGVDRGADSAQAPAGAPARISRAVERRGFRSHRWCFVSC